MFPYKDRPSYYDGEKFKKVHSPRENQANREGLIVDLDEKFNVTYSTIMFDGKCVIQKKANIPKWIPKSQKKYKLYLRFFQKRRMLEMFIQNPRIPSIESIKHFLGF